MANEKIILQVLTEQKEEVEILKKRKLISRKEESLFEFDSSLAQVVIGVRRSGKSTLCHKILNDKKIRYAYVNFDDERLATIQTEDLNTILSCIYQIYGTDISYIFLDEIQNVEGWYLFVNRLLRMNMHLFVTGSNAKLLSGELATHLTGRYNEIRLYPFSFKEYCQYHKIDTQGITTKSVATIKIAFDDYITNGGFPEIQNINNKRIYIDSLIEAILRKDIQKRFQIRNIEALRKIAHHLINNNCQEINYSSLSQLMNLTDKTVMKYISYLEQAFLIKIINKYTFKSRERIFSTKSYTIDPGLQSNRENSLTTENIGWKLENIVYIELLRRYANRYFDIYYYKTSSNSKEVDFVVCDKSVPVLLIQVAYDIENPKTFKRETSALIASSDKLKCNNLLLLSYTESNNIIINEKTIKIKSIIEWLLESPEL